MKTARDICTTALRRAHVVADGETPAAEQVTGALVSLNQMLDAWHDEGIRTGIRELDLDDDLLIDGGAELAITDNLAVMVADDAGLPVSGTLTLRSERGRASLVARYFGTKYPKFDRALLPRRGIDIENG